MNSQPAREQPLSFAGQLRDFWLRNFNWFLLAALALLLLQDIFGTHGLLAMRRSHKEAERMQHEINRVNEENRQLEERVKALKTDPHAIERIAREEMGLARPGEYIFKIQPNPGDASPSQPTAGAQKKP
ncbi:MAG TPA: septum formation initiator family protein [Candidatus Polarisedimenticolia bacterium]|jgi:cell division protein FtsB|nr:septum formation initiator family protein [Candidatus Polarisedimenticolia bacterium]